MRRLYLLLVLSLLFCQRSADYNHADLFCALSSVPFISLSSLSPVLLYLDYCSITQVLKSRVSPLTVVQCCVKYSRSFSFLYKDIQLIQYHLFKKRKTLIFTLNFLCTFMRNQFSFMCHSVSELYSFQLIY